ncbi:hypothetical protein FH972_022485 [Carpinus fangiana]|uniref:CCHC-type domain-containing protein n=1 Tax=Carpinus fangiana TaxID=176857 RepID=A0A5N6KSD9_9ROSI|nr:hypothetical protein FH972_022485 [Carpinus fangiana]
MADASDSRTAAVRKKRPLDDTHDAVSSKRARADTDNHAARESSAESGEIVSPDHNDDDEPAQEHEEAFFSNREVPSQQQPPPQTSTVDMEPSSIQTAQIQSREEARLAAFRVYQPSPAGDPDPLKPSTLKKVKGRLVAICINAPNAQATYGDHHVARLQDALCHYIGVHRSLLVHTRGFLRMSKTAWHFVRPNAHEAHLLLHVTPEVDVQNLIEGIPYSQCPVPGAPPAQIDAFKMALPRSSGKTIPTAFAAGWPERVLPMLVQGSVDRICQDLKSGKLNFNGYLNGTYEQHNATPEEHAALSDMKAHSSVPSIYNNDEVVPLPSIPTLFHPESQPQPPLPDGPPPVMLSDLSPSAQALQLRYWGISSPTALAVCDICSVPGHTSATCEKRRCIHCSADATGPTGHFSSACPKINRCQRCKELGHSASSCPSKLAAAEGDGPSNISCVLCGDSAHEIKDCQWLWRTYRPLPPANGTYPYQHEPGAVPLQGPQQTVKVALHRSCYNCGSQEHFGDDCPSRDSAKRPLRSDMFSASWSNQFDLNPYEAPTPRISAAGHFPGTEANTHILFTDDEDDSSEDDKTIAPRRPTTEATSLQLKPAKSEKRKEKKKKKRERLANEAAGAEPKVPKASKHGKKPTRSSNASGAVSDAHQTVQAPKPKAPAEVAGQFERLCANVGVPVGLAAGEKLERLRRVGARELVAASAQEVMPGEHEFRAVSDGGFVRRELFADIDSGDFARRMKERGVELLMGEVCDERHVYASWRAPTQDDYEGLKQRLGADYPPAVVDSAMKVWTPDGKLPTRWGDTCKDWKLDAYGRVYADLQVYGMARGFAAALERGGAGSLLRRWRIEWRSQNCDAAFPKEWGVTHGTDVISVWFWGKGVGEGLREDEKDKVRPWVEALAKYVKGEEDIGWGCVGARQVRKLTSEGQTIIEDDTELQKGLELWEAVRAAQRDSSRDLAKL